MSTTTKSWFQETSKSEWKNPNDIKVEYPNARILADNRVVFNIKGNNYRLIVKINYDYQMVWIRFVGTHAEYDKINAEKFKNMNIKPIKTEQDYNQALERLEIIFDAKKTLQKVMNLKSLEF